MSRRRKLARPGLIVALVVASATAGSGQTGTSTASPREHARLQKLLEQAFADKLADHPEFATYIGFPGHNHVWSDLSPAGIERLHARTREQLASARAIDRAALDADDRVDLDLFVRRLEGQVEGYRFPEEELAITQYGGIQQDVPFALAIAPASSSRDADDRLARLNAIPELVDQTIALLEKGRVSGVMPPRSQLLGVPAQVRALAPADAWQSPLLTRFRAIAADVEDEDAARLRPAALHAYEKRAAPAFRKLLSYLTDTYLPAARDTVGMGALPDGAAWYAYRLKKAITLDLPPRQVHELGLAEVKRIRAEMDKLIAGTGWTGGFAEFVQRLHTDPQFFYGRPEDLLEGYRALAKQIDARLPDLFGPLPSLPYAVEAIPSAEAPGKSTAYYAPGSVAQGRPGTCFVNTYDLRARPKWEMTPALLDQCMPGHHLQTTIAQSIRRPPKVLNYHDYTPFVEGWGVYAETLGDAMGLYRDPYAKFGQLSAELWRAMRVVVDTGLHAQGWTRQQALDYFRANTAQSDRAIEVEIDRYLYEPGLGVAYTLGAMKIRELRALAEKELGARFDVRAFHAEVLRHGALPLDMLEANVRAWVAAQAGADRKGS